MAMRLVVVLSPSTTSRPFSETSDTVSRHAASTSLPPTFAISHFTNSSCPGTAFVTVRTACGTRSMSLTMSRGITSQIPISASWPTTDATSCVPPCSVAVNCDPPVMVTRGWPKKSNSGATPLSAASTHGEPSSIRKSPCEGSIKSGLA